MNPNRHQDDFPEVQTAIYRVALSLDSFLLNGIPYGLIHREILNGFLEMTAGNLLTELARLEEYAHLTDQSRVPSVLATLRTRCQQLIDYVTGLTSFRDFSLEQLRSTVAQIPLLQGECLRSIEELECYFRTPNPFYPSRLDLSTTSVNDFLANLEHVFSEEWAASREERSGRHAEQV